VKIGTTSYTTLSKDEKDELRILHKKHKTAEKEYKRKKTALTSLQSYITSVVTRNLNTYQTGSYFLTTILILASSLEPYVSIPRSLPRMSHRMSHRMSKYLFPLPNDNIVVILFATYLSPIWCIYRGSRALFNRQSSYTWLSV